MWDESLVFQRVVLFDPKNVLVLCIYQIMDCCRLQVVIFDCHYSMCLKNNWLAVSVLEFADSSWAVLESSIFVGIQKKFTVEFYIRSFGTSFRQRSSSPELKGSSVNYFKLDFNESWRHFADLFLRTRMIEKSFQIAIHGSNENRCSSQVNL